MITIISGTNRNGSNTFKVAREYQQICKEKGIEANVLSLLDFDMNNDSVFNEKESDILIPTTHFIIVAPEYNGSIPGVLKTLIDKSR
ncbi:MAG: NAD(P)H-dependent oxidoreductase, partial [Ferruginibacter sp.]